MRYLSVCSGIEAATVAWHPLGWEPAAFSEIEPFPRRVLKHHYPEVPIHGDFTTIKGDEYGPIDLLVGGTPCQSFSIAGLRGGLGDDRGNLALEFLRLADRTRARWVVWENVPGVLSSNGGRDFGSILGGLVELGYGFAYRVLDAQYFGVAQRRRRVFVVGYLGDWRRAAAVLFERDSLSGNPAPRREARQGTARGIEGGVNFSGQTLSVGHNEDVAPTLDTGAAHTNRGIHVSTYRWQNENDGIIEDPVAASLRAKGTTTDERSVGAYVAQPSLYSIMPMNSGKDYKAREVEVAQPLMTSQVGGNQGGDFVVHPVVFHPTQDPIWSDDGSTHTMGTGNRNGHATVAVAFSCKDYGADATNDVSPTLRSMNNAESHANGGGQVAVGFYTNLGSQGGGVEIEASPTLKAADSKNFVGAATAMTVRRLTPRECERLQGFPDDYTLIDDKAADGPRYKALGNSMAVPVMRWLAERINMVEQ